MNPIWRLYRPFRPFLTNIEAHKYLKNIYWGLFDFVTPQFIDISHNGTTIQYRFREPRQVGTSFPSEYPRFLERLKPSDVFYDIGAHRGMYTCFAASAIPELAVVSIEPGPAIGTLRENVARNKLMNVGIERVLFGEMHDVITIPQSDNDKMVNLKGEADTGIDVPVIPGDDFVQDNDFPTPTVTKIDVEGAEGKVIRGLKNTLTTQESRLVFLELHHPNERSEPSTLEYEDHPQEVLDLLNDYGYNTMKVGQRRSQYFYICETE